MWECKAICQRHFGAFYDSVMTNLVHRCHAPGRNHTHGCSLRDHRVGKWAQVQMIDQIELDDKTPRAPGREPGIEPPDSGGTRSDTALVGIVAEKVLMAWLRNRYQLLFPFAIDLRRLDDAQFEVLVQSMITAARSDGSHGARDRERIEAVLRYLGSEDARHRSITDAALANPQPLNEVLRNVTDVQGGALVYAAALLVLDVRKTVNRRYLDYLAARLKLSGELIASLEQRYQSAA
jgi:Protein of unknown function (DUF533)